MIKTITPEAVNVKDKKTGTTNGKDWTLWPVGVAVKGVWYNGAIFNQDDLDYIQKDKPCTLDFFQEEYQGNMQWKFKVPNQTQQLIARVEELEQVVYGSMKPKDANSGTTIPKSNTPDTSDIVDDLPF
jgi:hypothetical protein